MENNTDLTVQDKIICECTGTTEAKIKQLIDNGVTNLDDIADKTGATTGCGSCDILIEELLEN